MDLLKLVGVAAMALAGPAAAHVSVQPTSAAAGAYQVLRFGVGHGCDGAATTAVRIALPPGLDAARPQPKPGWRLRIERSGEQVTAVTWRGRLPADQFEELVMLVKLPSEGAQLRFPALQTCGARSIRWMDEEPGRPSPTLRLAPAAPPQDKPHDQH